MKQYKAILINAQTETVSEVTVSTQNFVDAANLLIGSDCYTCGPRLDNGDGVLVDDEGLLKLTPETKFFTFGDYPQPLAGNGLVVGCNLRNGNTKDVQSTVDEVKQRVSFYTLAQVRRGVARGLWA